MENKNTKILIILVAILIVLVLGVIAYLVYDKISEDNNDVSNNINDVNNNDVSNNINDVNNNEQNNTTEENNENNEEEKEPEVVPYTSLELFTMLTGNWASVSQKSDMVIASFNPNHFMLGWFASEPFYSGDVSNFTAVDVNNYSFDCNGATFYIDITDFANGNISIKVDDSEPFVYEFVSTNQDDLFDYFGLN